MSSRHLTAETLAGWCECSKMVIGPAIVNARFDIVKSDDERVPSLLIGRPSMEALKEQLRALGVDISDIEMHVSADQWDDDHEMVWVLLDDLDVHRVKLGWSDLEERCCG